MRLSPRVFSQKLLEETGTIEAIVGVLYDLFPDNSDDGVEDSNPNSVTARTAASALDSTRSSLENFPPSSSTIADELTERSQALEETEQRPVSPTTPSTPTTPLHSARDATLSARASEQQDQQTAREDVFLIEQEDQTSTRTTLSSYTLEQRTRAMLFPVIELVFELSSHQRCAEVLVVTGALHYIVFVLETIQDPHDELLPLCVVALWNVLELCHEKMRAMPTCASRRELLEHYRVRNAAYFLANAFTLNALMHVLELLLARGYRKQDKELRNECLVVLTLLARRRCTLDHFYSTGLTASLFSYATAAETAKKRKPQSKSSAAAAVPAMPSSARAVAINADHHNYATSSDEDFEFKQLLWFLIAEITTDHDANVRELVQFRFTEILLAYATGGWASNDRSASASSGSHHTPAQLHALQTTALSVLNHIAPSVREHVYDLNGHAQLLDYLQHSVLQSDETLANAWLLFSQLAPPTRSCQDALGALGAVEIALTAFAAPPSRHTFGIRRNAIAACASMCRNHEANRRRFYDAHGVHAVVQHLAFDPSHAVLEEHIVVAIVDAVRSCIVGDAESESAFIDDDGVPKLLAMLERVPLKAVKAQVLAALAEICVNPAAIPSFRAWRSDVRETNNFTATQLLLRIYAAEDAIEALQIKSAQASDSDVVALAHARHSAFDAITTCKSPFVVATKGTAGDDRLDSDEQSMATVSNAVSSSDRPQSPAFARLKDALKAAQSGLASPQFGAQRPSSLLSLHESESHHAINIKAKVYAVLANVSFATDGETDADSALSARDRVLLEVAKEYATFQVGEMWQTVHLALHAEGVRPIYADALYIRRHIEHAYNVSVATKHTQMAVLARASDVATADEQAFLDQILLQKQQEAQAEAFHRASLQQNSTLKLHFDAKRTRLEFLRKQDPTAYAALSSSSSSAALLLDPPPACDCSDLNSLDQKEAELRGRLGTLGSHKSTVH